MPITIRCRARSFEVIRPVWPQEARACRRRCRCVIDREASAVALRHGACDASRAYARIDAEAFDVMCSVGRDADESRRELGVDR